MSASPISTPSFSPTESPTEEPTSESNQNNNSLPVWAIAVAAVGGLLVLAAIIILAIATVMHLNSSKPTWEKY
jgi:hypothetical protein